MPALRRTEVVGVWPALLAAAVRATLSDRMVLAAAGCAFFATLALFPAMSMLVSLYGLVFNPRAVEAQMLLLRDLLPNQAYWLIADRLHHLVVQRPMHLGIGLGLSIVMAFWSSLVSLRSLLAAINHAYGDAARPTFLRFQVTALGLTLLGVVGTMLLLAVLVGLPGLLRFVTPWSERMRLAHLLSVVLLAWFAFQTVALLYRFAPAHSARRVVLPGTVLAVACSLAASGLLTLEISHVADLGATYGPLGAAAGVMLWLFGNASAVLLGAELNARIERHRMETMG
jgi:membrane protein